VAILAELVRERAAGGLQPQRGEAAPTARPDTQAIDPVCAMTVRAGQNALVHDGVTYSFCSIGCRDAFAADPPAFISADNLTQEA
jgi:YHS domain-containing protein